MAEDTIIFDPLGTVTVTFDGNTYKLGRPKFGQWRYFSRKITEMAATARDTLNLLAADVAVATNLVEEEDTPENRAEQEAAAARLKEFTGRPFHETSSELLREMFAQLSEQPLPEDSDDWPAWLVADVSLPNQIVQHWRTAPKASGSQNGN